MGRRDEEAVVAYFNISWLSPLKTE
jgi:hypothetical protein